MKKSIVFLIIVTFGIFISKGQENSCPLEIYKLVFEEANLYKNKAVEIEIGYKPHESIIKIISKLNIFKETEIKQFYNLANNVNYLNCIDLNKEVESLLSDDRIRENGNYMKYLFSNVVSITESKKAVLTYAVMKSKKYEGGKAIGGEIIYILNKENNKWVLTDKKPLSMY